MDIAPELIKSIKEEFEDIIRRDAEYSRLLEKINSGKATYLEAHKLAVRIGDDLAKAYKLKISSDVLPDGKMYYNIAERLLYDTIERPNQLVSQACEVLQTNINTVAGIGLKAAVPELNTDRLDGLIERLSSGELFDDIAWILDDPIINYMQSTVDDFVKENARIQTNAGLSPKIVRRALGGCCKWCRSIAGTYNYDEVSNTGNDVFRRHENCRCSTEYVPEFGKQDVWSKKITYVTTNTGQRYEMSAKEFKEQREFLEHAYAHSRII